MTITSLGHAGFLIEAGADTILADPWFDPAGAYAASWFPYPSNELIDLAGLERANILYVSHWHRDHLDEWFLKGRSKEFKERVRVLVPNFKYKKLRDTIRECGYMNIEECGSFESIKTDSGTELSIIYDANPLFVDSALFVRSGNINFLNANDCKLSVADEEKLVKRYGAVDIFTAQFSGATFHPTCYTYSEEKKRAISESRRKAKFDRIVSSFERLGAAYYIPSAGPACFLSDELFHLNLNPATVFSSAADFKEYLRTEELAVYSAFTEILPGEKFILSGGEGKVMRSKSELAPAREYLTEYANKKKEIIAAEIERYRHPIGNILSDTKQHFRSLYANVPALAVLAAANLEVKLTGEGSGTFFLNTVSGEISDSPFDNSLQRYMISLDSFWMRAIIDGLMSWEDFILSFRFSIERDPDIYNEAIIAFLHLETEEERKDYITYHEFIGSGEKERVTRICDGMLIEHDRYCPHNGEDLSSAAIKDGILTCPRHFWQFAIEDGHGLNNSATINVIRKEATE
ncbi:MAG: MBL fold metallo-hydrolase [Bacteroidota bacterium]|nr:MBL fold metallo-hydrolase [Bacteroidota bacterium]